VQGSKTLVDRYVYPMNSENCGDLEELYSSLTC